VLVITAAGLVELAALLRRTDHGDGVNQMLVVAIALPLLIVVAALPGKRPGLSVSIHRVRPMFDFVASLPSDVLIAGWPKGDMTSVRLYAGRRTLVDYENHLAFHRRAIELLRPRATLSIQAALSHSDEPLRRLRDEHGVTHFLHRRRGRDWQPRYFKPFQAVIRDTLAARGDRPPAVERLAETAAVYRDRRNIVLDLALAFPPTHEVPGTEDLGKLH
jgi:hypothetical protein